MIPSLIECCINSSNKAMNDIDAIKKQAQKGDIQSQIDLAHAYLKGEGVVKNRAHYLNWLTKAAEQGSAEAQCELVEYHSNKKNKNADPTKALYWLQEARKVGVDFTNEQLLKAGDPNACNEQIEIFLFGEDKSHDFAKAKELLLRVNLPQEKLSEYAQRYYDTNHNNVKRLSNICYLLKLSFDRNHEKLNEYAVGLIKSKAKNSMKIAFSLFAEAYSLGNPYAASSYPYCLLNGKGCKRDIKSGASIYFDCKRKNINIDKAFVSPTNPGIAAKLPNSFVWKMYCLKHKIAGLIGITTGASNGILTFISRGVGALWSLVKNIGIASIVTSGIIVFCVVKLKFSWCISSCLFLEDLTPISWGGYLLLFIALTALFSISSLFFKKRKNKQLAENLRNKWDKYGLSLPSFYVVDVETVDQKDGCYGPSTSTTVYTIRFVENFPNASSVKKNYCWESPVYAMEKINLRFELLTPDTAKVWVYWKYTP